MSGILGGQCLSWVAFDPQLAVSAALKSMLASYLRGQRIRLQLDVAKSLDEAALWACRQQISLLTIVVERENSLALGKCLWQVRARSPATLRIVVAKNSTPEFVALLLEAGAQIVVREIPSLQRLLPRIVERLPLKSLGFHPLTSGLAERLPWREVDRSVLATSQRSERIT